MGAGRFAASRLDSAGFRGAGRRGHAGQPDNRLILVPVLGQSFTQGSAPGAAQVLSPASGRDLMFAAGPRAHADQLAPGDNINAAIDPAGLQATTALQEQLSPFSPLDFGETVLSGMAGQIARRCLCFTAGRGAYPIESLMRDAGVITDQHHWINAHAAFLYARDRADDLGLVLDVPFVVWLHGSANAGNGTTRGAYKARMRQLVADLRAMIGAAALVDARATQVIVDQVSYRHDARQSGAGDDATGYGAMAVADIELHREGVLRCAGPRYPHPFVASNDLHYSSAGYRAAGAQDLGPMGQGIAAGNSPGPVHIPEAPHRVGATITVPMQTREGALIHDAATFAARNLAHDGFAYEGAGIVDVSLAHDGAGDGIAEIIVTLDAAAPGTLRLAYENADSDTNNEVGCHFRDEGGNWPCIDEWEIA